MGFGFCLPHCGKAEIEFVIADGHGVVVEGVEGGYGGIRWGGLLFCEVVEERSAFGGVAAVEEEGVGSGGALLLDESGDLVEAVGDGLGGGVVPGEEMAVGIGGGEEGDGGGGGLGMNWKGGEENKEKKEEGIAREEPVAPGG